MAIDDIDYARFYNSKILQAAEAKFTLPFASMASYVPYTRVPHFVGIVGK